LRYKEGEPREQISMLPDTLDDYVDENYICRIIEAFVENINMNALGYKYAKTSSTGRPPYDPRMMLKLYIYGYLHRIRSSRRLEAETKRNIEVMWLIQKQSPDDKTICNFRKDNSKALRSTFWEFSRLCNRLGLYGKQVVAIDGTKIRADNSRINIHTPKRLKENLAAIEKKVAQYMRELDEHDADDTHEGSFDAAAIKQALEELKEKSAEHQAILKNMEESGISEMPLADKDCRLMICGGDGRRIDARYNFQSVVDGENNIIVDFDVVQRSNDNGNMHKLTESAKEIMSVKEITVLGDKGYYEGEDISRCEADGTLCVVAKPDPGEIYTNKGYSTELFEYDREKDCYTCPQRNILPYIGNANHKGKMFRHYKNEKACSQCQNRKDCTNSPKGRLVMRSVYKDSLDVVDKRVKDNPDMMQKRRAIVEPLFGTIKAIWGYTSYLCRGLEKVTGEQSLTCLAYNMRRAFNIFTGEIPHLIVQMAAR
jgi:transposase